jgi:rhodanese-related sulfurtransferase/DNA-binding transcriptional ArsR family regulator
MKKRDIKDLLYEQVARIGKALSSPKRLEIIELLAQGEKTVDALASEVSIDIKLASAHLRALREARLVESRREGKYVVCRLSGPDVAALWIALRGVAEEHLVELKVALDRLVAMPDRLNPVDRQTLLRRAHKNEVVVLDVRPEEEFRAGHLPFARSMPVEEIERRLGELPKSKEIVAYCRGAFCLMSDEAVKLLSAKGYRVRKMAEGVTDWLAAGLPIESESPP